MIARLAARITTRAHIAQGQFTDRVALARERVASDEGGAGVVEYILLALGGIVFAAIIVAALTAYLNSKTAGLK